MRPLSADAVPKLSEAAIKAAHDEYAIKLGERIRRNIVYQVMPNLVGNPGAGYLIKIAPNGAISVIQKLRSSGYADFDAALLRAIEKSAPFAKSGDGTMPVSFEITVLMKDLPAQ